MQNEKLRQQTYRKLKLVMDGYASLIYEKTGEIENAEYLFDPRASTERPGQRLAAP